MAENSGHDGLSLEPLLGPIDCGDPSDRCSSTNDHGDRCTKRALHKGKHYAIRPSGGWGRSDEPQPWPEWARRQEYPKGASK